MDRSAGESRIAEGGAREGNLEMNGSDPNRFERSDDVRRLIPIVRSQARRSFVVEVAGTPKAGKSTTIETLRRHFQDAGFAVHVMEEQAAVCRLPMKGHFFFNAWTTTRMISELVASVDLDADLLILDRGCFDALVWLELQLVRGQVSPSEASAFEQFVLLDRWRSLVDTTLVMRVRPETAMDREFQATGNKTHGSLMNPTSLGEFNSALETVANKHAAAFRVHDLECDDQSAEGVASNVIGEVTRRLEAWVDPNILVVDLDDARAVFAGGKTIDLRNGKRDGWTRLIRATRSMRRSDAENDSSVVQFAAAGLVRCEDEVCIFERSESARTDTYGRSSMAILEHLTAQDGESDPLLRLESVANSRITTYCHLAPGTISSRVLGAVWHADDGRSDQLRHLGVVFESRVSRSIASQIAKKKWKTGTRGHPSTSSFFNRDDLRTIDSLEPWSRAILESNWLG